MYPQLNKLQDTFGPKGFQVLAVPCNQFGLQENSSEDELMNMLKYVRPGAGYEPNFPIFGMVDVNGENAHAAFSFLREAPAPKATKERHWLTSTESCNLKTQLGAGDDIQWNFEKFLVGRDGKVIGRYLASMPPEELSTDIEAALKE